MALLNLRLKDTTIYIPLDIQWMGLNCVIHRSVKITDKTLNVVFSRFVFLSFTITLRQKPKGVMCSRRRTGSLCVELQDRAWSTLTTHNPFGLLSSSGLILILYPVYCNTNLDLYYLIQWSFSEKREYVVIKSINAYIYLNPVLFALGSF